MPTVAMNRRRLVDLIFGPHATGGQNLLREERVASNGDEMVVTWRDEGTTSGGIIPRAITLPREKHHEFLAWAYTYLAPIRPFTAYVRLFDPTTADFLLRPISFQGYLISDADAQPEAYWSRKT
jgi:hypothetical protein